MASRSVQAVRFFYGLQPRWFTSDRLYRIYVANNRLSGAYIAGQLYDERSAAIQLQQLAFFLRPFVRRCLARRQQLEAHYDQSDPFSSHWLDQDQRNFQIERSVVVRTSLHRRRSLWTPFNAGVVKLELLDGSIRRFILIGEPRVDEVLDLLRTFDPGAEASGTPNPLRRPKPMTPTAKRLQFVVLALMLLGFSGTFAYVGLRGRINDPSHLPLAAVNLLAALWCLATAWRQGRNRPPTEGTA